MKTIKILLLISLTLISSACPSNDDETGHKYITIVNNSNSKIRIQTVWSISINKADTFWHCRLPAPITEQGSNRQFECSNSDRGKSWENDFNAIPYIQFLIFDAETYDEYRDYGVSCEETNYTIPVLYRYQLKLEDLERMNWTVVYSPEE